MINIILKSMKVIMFLKQLVNKSNPNFNLIDVNYDKKSIDIKPN